MRNLCVVLLLVGLGGWPLTLPESVWATTILSTATDLPDGATGDLWQYSYTVSEFPFDKNVGFSIFFVLGKYSDLEDPPPPVNADWDVAAFQPDPGLPADGFYDALALTDGASLADPFTVRFLWLGDPGTVPGSQPFIVYALDDQDVLHMVEFGTTTVPGAAVPEPRSPDARE